LNLNLDLDLYKRSTSFVLGFHGCDKEVGEAVLAGEAHLIASKNDYDWLGAGVYFWEGNPARAQDFAERAAAEAAYTTRGSIKNPFVVGAILDLGMCFGLQDSACLDDLVKGHEALLAACNATGVAMPTNKGRDDDRSARFLDCAVVEAMQKLRANNDLPAYDSVRAAFTEGGALYDGSAFCKKAHVQIAVRNPAKCILGYFRPLTVRVGA
jgi:hypothetical protein